MGSFSQNEKVTKGDKGFSPINLQLLKCQGARTACECNLGLLTGYIKVAQPLLIGNPTVILIILFLL